MQIKAIILNLLIIHCTLSLKAQTDSNAKADVIAKINQYARFVGEYDLEGTVIQFALQNDVLFLIVPGAPIQELKAIAANEFKSAIFKDQRFIFTESNGKIIAVTSKDQRGVHEGKKISNSVLVSSVAMDSLLVLRKSTEHFLFLYTVIDSVSLDSIAADMEKNYKRILNDFKLRSIPNVSVRIYPDLKSFHNGINFPGAPDQVLATAFGKDDIRMVSPNNAGPERWMLAHFAQHEFTHCVHLNIDYSPNNPRWLWEGVAQFEAKWFFDPKDLEFMKRKEYPHLVDLNGGVEYMLGFVLIEAIRDLWGFDAVINLVKNQGNVKTVLKINENEFEEKVFEHIFEKYVQNK
jgi:hypothetical protein